MSIEFFFKESKFPAVPSHVTEWTNRSCWNDDNLKQFLIKACRFSDMIPLHNTLSYGTFPWTLNTNKHENKSFWRDFIFIIYNYISPKFTPFLILYVFHQTLVRNLCNFCHFLIFLVNIWICQEKNQVHTLHCLVQFDRDDGAGREREIS